MFGSASTTKNDSATNKSVAKDRTRSIHQQLLGDTKTKTSLVAILETLDKKGVLTEGVFNKGAVRHELKHASTALGTENAPYGPLVQVLEVEH